MGFVIRFPRNAAIARHDIETQLSFLDSLYQISLGNGGLEHGKASQREGTARAFARAPDVVYVRTPDTIDVSASQTRAAELGTWIGTATENGMVRRWGGRYAGPGLVTQVHRPEVLHSRDPGRSPRGWQWDNYKMPSPRGICEP